MLVHLCSYRLTNTPHLPRSAVGLMADAARRAGAVVIEGDGSLPGADVATTAASCAAHLRQQWREQRPDLVHTFGLAATMAAVEVGGVPIVATFDESPTPEEAELRLAERVTAVMPLSAAEGERWRRRGIPTLSAGIFPTPVPAVDLDPVGKKAGHVVTMSDGPVLDALVSEMSRWGSTPLVVGAQLTPERWSELCARAAHLGVLDLLHHRPRLRGSARARMWVGAAVLVAGPEVSRHGGYVLEAAAYGVPAVATAQDAHLDLVVSGTSGILVPLGVQGSELARVVTALLEDEYRLRALGCAAQVRVRAAHDPRLVADRLLDLYRALGAIVGPDAAMESAGARQPAAAENVPDVERCHAAPAASDGDSGTVDREDRDALVAAHLPLARQLAGWYARRGQAREDLVQVACLGLVLAAERFDPNHGTAFHSFAVPTILGELRRHFRNHAWDVRVPRAMQESVLEVRRAADDLEQSLGRVPTPADLSAALGIGQDEVRAALCTAGQARGVGSLDHADAERPALAERLGSPDPGHDLVDVRGDVQAVLSRLPEREKQVLLMRFHAEMTQSQIAERLGISQVHVSRLITRTLAAIREHILTDSPLPPAWLGNQLERATGTESRIARAS
jgi:RNA polymerase sigma-B factor